MSQEQHLTSMSPTSEVSSLSPVLRAALDSLDIDFEQELIRFRRERSLSSTSSINPLPFSPIPPPVFSGPSRTSSAFTNLDEPEQSPFDLSQAETEPEANAVMFLPVEEAPSSLDSLQAEELPEEQPEELAEEESEELLSLDLPPESLPFSESSLSIPSLLTAPTSVSQLLESSVEGNAEDVDHNFDWLSETNLELEDAPPFPAPDDYLASSEALLQSLDEPEPPLPSKPTRDNESLLLSVTVGALLALLVVCGAVGFLVLSPGKLGEPSQKSSKLPSKSKSLDLRLSPNLAATEFQDLSNVSLGTLPSHSLLSSVSSGEISAIAAVPNPPSLESALSVGLELPSSTTATPPGGQSDRYYVVLSASDEQTLQRVQQVIPDAFLERFPAGMQIQLGVFSEVERAKILVQELQQQGLSAEVYRP